MIELTIFHYRHCYLTMMVLLRMMQYHSHLVLGYQFENIEKLVLDFDIHPFQFEK